MTLPLTSYHLGPDFPRRQKRFFRLLTGLIGWFALASSLAFAADPMALKNFNVPAGEAPVTLKEFSLQAGEQLMYSASTVSGVQTAAVKGSLASRDAIERMLAGTALVAVQDATSGGWAIRRRDEISSEPGNPALPGGFGEVRGRVQNLVGGGYVANARVTIDGQNLATSTDQSGSFVFPRVAAGSAIVRVVYTGFPTEMQTVSVLAQESNEVNFAIRAGGTGKEQTIVLDAFSVAEQKDMAASDIAVNEQRFSPSIKNVVSTDSFGDFADGNVGEFAKYLPGVTLNRSGSDGLSISLGGVPPSGTPISLDGNALASAASSNADRTVEFENISITNMSRVEVTRSPMPDNPASAIGGSVNLISKSAFEQSRPITTVRTYISTRAQDFQFNKEPGPFAKKIYPFEPNFEISSVIPVTKNFGFSIGGLVARTANNGPGTLMTWEGTNLASSAAYPAAPANNPYLARYRTQERPKITVRESISFSADWRVAPRDVITVGMQYAFFTSSFWVRQQNFDVGRVASFGETFTQGAAGAGIIQIITDARDKAGTTYMPSIRWKHDGPVWKWQTGGAFSAATNHYSNKGYFQNNNAFFRNVTIRFEDMDRDHPRVVSVKNAAGADVNPYDLNNYSLESIGGLSFNSTDFVRSAYANTTRTFDGWLPITLKAGFDFRSQSRDMRRPTDSYNFVGADGVARTADDNANQWYDPIYSQREPIYGPKMQWFNLSEIGRTITAHPEYLSTPETSLVNRYRSNVTTSQQINELISAPYLRFDTRMMDGRLSVSGGVRYERTDDKGSGSLIDPTRTYQRDAAGNIVRNAAGVAQVIAPLTSLAGTKLAYIERGSKLDNSYDGLFPSITANYNALQNLIVRLSYGRAINRPAFSDFLPSATVPDSEGTERTIILSNGDLKPWIADSYSAALEYYFDEPSSGVASVRLYRRNITDFWGAVTRPASNDLLAQYGLDPAIYGEAQGYQITTKTNVGDARIDGMELDYRQNLRFLPNWGRGLTVFANLTMQHLTGSNDADFSNYVSKTINYGVTFSRARFTARFAMNLKGRVKQTRTTGADIAAGTYQYLAPRPSADASVEYRATRNLSVFLSGRNVNSTVDDTLVYSPNTRSDRRITGRAAYGATCYFGVKGTF